MAVERIEQYRQLNGVDILKVILKPTTKFPNGYFFAPAEAVDLVNSFTWGLHTRNDRVEVVATLRDFCLQKTLYFHKELFKLYRGYDWQGDIDHINIVEIDNIDQNLNAVSHKKNGQNTFSRGYRYHKDLGYFQTQYTLNYKIYRPHSIVDVEDKVCKQANEIDKVILKEELGDDYYRFDFLKYRRGSEDILDLERTGVISEEEATYRHIMRYADNAWYYLRFGLQSYFEENNIPVPQYNLDKQGFMINKVTGQRLCPYKKGGI